VSGDGGAKSAACAMIKHKFWRALRCLGILMGLGLSLTAVALDHRGAQFIGLDDFSGFYRSTTNGVTTLISPEVHSAMAWKELVLSWNADAPSNSWINFEVRGFYKPRVTRYFTMAKWSPTRERLPRTSIKGQRDEDAYVDTDTLICRYPCDAFQLRITMGGDPGAKPRLKFLGIALKNPDFSSLPLKPNRLAWGKVLPVLERSQMAYENGGVICSPTTVSMMMDFWSHKLNRPELAKDVPEIARGVYDTAWGGTGNWAFNMAWAGSYSGMRAYVTRMSDLSELEDWIDHGVPVGLSVCYDLLRGRRSQASGHLVVCVGFTANGDVVINDPGTSRNVQKVFKRKNVERAWAYSKNAAYVIHPAGAVVPKDRFGHWDSWSSHLEYELIDGLRPEKR
jgi:hypothetical protein